MLIGFSFPSIFAILCCLWIPCNINSTQWQHSHWPTSGDGCFESHNSFMSQQLCTPRCSALEISDFKPKKCFRIRDFSKLLWQYIRWRLDRIPLETTLPVDWIAFFGHQVASRNEKMPTTKNNQKLSSLSCRSARSSAGNGISRLCFTAPFLL